MQVIGQCTTPDRETDAGNCARDLFERTSPSKAYFWAAHISKRQPPSEVVEVINAVNMPDRADTLASDALGPIGTSKDACIWAR